MGYLAVNPDDTFVVFDNKPTRCKEEIMKITQNVDYDFYGKEHFKEAGTGEYKEFWGTYSQVKPFEKFNKGVQINPSNLGVHIQDRYWSDEPIEI